MPIKSQDQLNLLSANVTEICYEVGHFISSQLGRISDDDILEKDIHSLVSYVDIESEKKLVAQLTKLIPASGFITEENTVEASHSAEYTWIIDPLDGTTNFLKGIPIFCISIGLLHNSTLKLGTIYHIKQNELFHAVKAGGAYLNGVPIKVSPVMSIKDAVIATGFPYQVKNMAELSGILNTILNTSRGVRRLGSAAIDLAYTACGRFDAYYEASINSWDVAAGILLVEEAGGMVTEMDGSPNPLFSKNVLASNINLHQELINLIQETKSSL